MLEGYWKYKNISVYSKFSVSVPQPWLPKRAFAVSPAIERKTKRRRPWSQQDIVAEAIKEWLSKHVSKQSLSVSHLISGVFHDVLTLFPSSMSMRMPTISVIAP
jgi:hypothetical protein